MVPIIIGITGHRDLRQADVEDLESSVRAIFQEIIDKYPSSPIKVLSPLAEGADRLVARIAIALKTKNVSLIVPLPMPRSEYEKDFKTEESKKEFTDLLAKAENVFELPLMNGVTLENIQGYNEPRNRQYASVGAYVALRSQILIALWDGKDTKETGGTSEIVRFKLEGVPEPYTIANHPLDLPDNGPVYHIFTRRERKQTEITENNHAPEVKCLPVQAGQWDILYPPGWKKSSEWQAQTSATPEKQAMDYYDEMLLKIDNFNADAKILASSAVVNSKGYILSKEQQSSLSKGLTEMLDCYANADIAAQSFQKKSDNALKWLLSAPVIAFFFFGVFDELWSMAYVLALFPVFFGVAYFIYKHTAKKEYDRKFSDYRVLAEGLRVQFFWKLAGLRENVTDHYHRKYKAEMNWIFYAIRNISIKANVEVLKHPASGIKEKLETVKTHWIEDQEKYYVKNAVKRTTLAEDAEKFTTRFFVIAMVFVLGLFAMKTIILLQQGSLENIVDMNDIKNWTLYSVFLVLIDTFIATGAARAVYVEKKGFNEEAKQFQRMKDLFQKGNNVMIECLKKDDLKGAEKLVIELGKEALTENGDWLILRRSKPMEAPLG